LTSVAGFWAIAVYVVAIRAQLDTPRTSVAQEPAAGYAAAVN